MAFFSNTWNKMFVGTGGFDSASAGSKPNALTALEMGIVDASTHNLISVNATPDYMTTPMIYLAQGSSRTFDTHGMHGGYKESIKSRGINPQFVEEFYVVEPQTPVNQIVCVGCEDFHEFLCNTTYRLRIDVKGSPVLRTFNRQLYKTFDAFTGCCGSDPTDPVDPSIVFEAWKAAINADTNFSPFVTAEISYWVKIGGTWTDVGNEATSDDQVCSVTVTGVGSYAGATVPTWTQSVSVGTGTTFQTHMEALTATISAPGTGYAPGDIIEVVGGTKTTAATYTVATTQTVSATIINAGDGYAALDTLTIPGAGATDTEITVDTVDAAGHILTFTISTAGSYTTNPGDGVTTVSASATGDGATFALVMGALTVTAATRGDYTVTPASAAATTASTGSGTGATLTALWRVLSVEVLTKGEDHDVAPTLTVSSGAATATAVLCPDWATTANEERTNKLCLTAAFEETTFGNCSFELTDHYEMEPLRIYASVTQDDGTPCDDEEFCVETTQDIVYGKNHGNTLLKELALSNSYRQDYFIHDERIREVMEDNILTDISKSTRYYVYYITHFVPRKKHPGGMYNAERYTLKIVTSSRITAFETFMNTYLTSAGSPVQLEVV